MFDKLRRDAPAYLGVLRLGNVEILSSKFGVINPDESGGLLQTWRIGNPTLRELYAALDIAEATTLRGVEPHDGSG
jgi:hypothetical protein